MRCSNVRRGVGALIVLLLVTSVLSVPVAAAVTLNVDTQYEGTAADSQAISTTVTLSPEDNAIVNATVQIQETNQGFVDQESFTTTVDPSGSDAEITYEGNGRFSINQLEPGETVQITFDAYPRTIKEESLHVATVSVDYTQQGQSLSDQQQVVADLSNSSYFAWQDAQESLQQQQWLFYLGIVVVGIGAVVVLYKIYEWWTGGTFDSSSDDF